LTLLTNYIGSVGEIEITAGQLYQSNTTFLLQFINPSNNVTLAELHLSFDMWMSFVINSDFIVSEIDIGKPYIDRKISAFITEPSLLGDLNDEDWIVKGFEKYVTPILQKGYDLYTNLMKQDKKLVYLRPTFSDSSLQLIDRYVSLFINPNFNTTMKFLYDTACDEPSITNSGSWFWKIV
jgi:hypothetical protein